jgi:hypothetical protein
LTGFDPALPDGFAGQARRAGELNQSAAVAAGAILKITATDCDAVRRPAEGWQKDEWDRKMGFFRFFRPYIFLPGLRPRFFIHTFPFRFGLHRQFIKRTIQLKYYVVNRYLKEFLRKL